MAWNLKNDVNKNVSFNFEGLESIKHYDDVDLTFTDSSLFDNKMEILKEEFGLVRNLPPVNAKILIRNTHAKEEEPDTTKPVESEEDLTGTDSK